MSRSKSIASRRWFGTRSLLDDVMKLFEDLLVEAVRVKVRAAFDSYVHGNEVRFTAACWMVAARKPNA
jgi:hypothetical protein